MQGKETVPTVKENIKALFVVVSDGWQFEGFFDDSNPDDEIRAIEGVMIQNGLAVPPPYTSVHVPTFRKREAPEEHAQRAADYKAAHENRDPKVSQPVNFVKGKLYRVSFTTDNKRKMFILPYVGEGVGELEDVLYFGTKGLPSSMSMVRRSWIISVVQVPE